MRGQIAAVTEPQTAGEPRTATPDRTREEIGAERAELIASAKAEIAAKAAAVKEAADSFGITLDPTLTTGDEWMNQSTVTAATANATAKRANEVTDYSRTMAGLIADGMARAASGHIEKRTGKLFNPANPFGAIQSEVTNSKIYGHIKIQAARKITFAWNGGNKDSATYGTPLHPMLQITGDCGLLKADYEALAKRRGYDTAAEEKKAAKRLADSKDR